MQSLVSITYFALFTLIHAALLAAEQAPVKVYPSAKDPSVFALQVESLLRATTATGDGFGGIYDRELGNRVRLDSQDWESALARIINDPSKYGFRLGEEAISVAKLRGSCHNDTIVSACEVYFGAVVKDAMDKLHEFEARGEKVPHWVSGSVHAILSGFLDFNDPRILHMALRHLASNEGMELGMLDKFVVTRIPEALRASGDASHRDEALALAKRLREVGSEEIAEGIEMWTSRAGTVRHPAKGGSEERLQPLNRKAVSLETDGKPHTILWSVIWLTGSLIVVASGLLVWRRSSGRH